MEEETGSKGCQGRPGKWREGRMGSHDTSYGLGVLGAAVYFVQRAEGAGAVLLALLKAIFWPAVVVYKALDLLKL